MLLTARMRAGLAIFGAIAGAATSVFGLTLALAHQNGDYANAASIFTGDVGDSLLGWPLALAGTFAFVVGLRSYFGALASPLCGPPLPRAIAQPRRRTVWLADLVASPEFEPEPAPEPAPGPEPSSAPATADGFPVVSAIVAVLGFVIAIAGLAMITPEPRPAEGGDSFGLQALGDAAARMVGVPVLVVGAVMFVGAVFAIVKHINASNRS